jgi:Family of unknown function (DUF5995)
MTVQHRADKDAAAVSARANALAARNRLEQLAARMVDDRGRPHDSRWWFTNSYVRTTEGAVEEADAGSFTDPVFIFRLITYFEKLYIDNVLAADEGRWVEPHWQRAFDIAAHADARRRVFMRMRNMETVPSGVRAVVASVVAASRAHVRFDLPRAMTWVQLNQPNGSGGGDIRSHVGDFMAMAAVFEQATLAANRDVAKHTRLPFQYMPGWLQEWGMRHVFRADLIHERAYAWECAEALVAAGGAGDNPYTEPEPGRLEGDVTADRRANAFSGIELRLRPTMDGLRRAPAETPSRGAAGLPDALDTIERVRALQGLCHGHTGPGDERAMIALLAASARMGDLVAVVNGVGAWELAANLQGREKRALRTLLRAYYYPHVQPSIAAALIRRAMRFAELPWEETMVADLLCDRYDAPALLAAIGGDEYTGWRRIEDDLSRESRSRLLAAKPHLG